MSVLAALALMLAQPAYPGLPDPAADYIEPGQDFAGYEAWLASNPAHVSWVMQYKAYLDGEGVGDVVPIWQLLRTASQWRDCGQPAFEMPPQVYWPAMAETLRFVKDFVKPGIGEVEAVSVYRNPYLNSCAGGSARSVHRANIAIDLVPRYPFERGDLMSRLCTIHARHGRDHDAGLGVYQGIRFHIDTWQYRTWGISEAEGGDQCRIAWDRRESARSEE
ncbi:hypothetical protein [Sphingomicrobium flavum]|uniref:hypothetical protein n=1 Tax=Sphingomicrobium flavum TaxID=1229164 RepID=UPI0021AE0729|nr:hypothetical protein [Sphingomicrobium flavum]